MLIRPSSQLIKVDNEIDGATEVRSMACYGVFRPDLKSTSLTSSAKARGARMMIQDRQAPRGTYISFPSVLEYV